MFSKWTGLKFVEFLKRKKKKKYWTNQQPKAVKRLVKYEKIERKKMRVNGLGFFAPIFSRWTGLKFVEIYEKKIEKLKKLSFGCHFGRKRREKKQGN